MKSVRLRLLILALLPLVVVMPLLLAAGMNRWATQFDALLITNVESDLRIADQYLQQIMTISGNDVQALARSVEFQDVLRDEVELADVLKRYRDSLGLDFLTYLPVGLAEAEAKNGR
jgi:two-component system NtrC family sensor kinase